ncbi:MFS transporter [Vreelandella titanicae]|uniref:MFS transporter n=1 Tax=Halomonadaceae TaxID=28256 RepID=UPI001BB26DE6|nr:MULTISPECIES: MFS transporter [Halomonas]UEQ05058.1 MFS transporter [Halomonas profundus]
MVKLPDMLSNTVRPRPVLTVMAIFLGAVLTTLQGRLFSMALTDLRGQFGLDVLEAAWLGTALNGAQLITMPIVPWLATVIGPTRVLVAPSLVLGLVTLLIPISAQNYPMLLILHSITGLCLGIYLPLTVSLALRNLQPQFWLMVMAAYSLRVSTGMDAGVGISGFFVEEISWHWVYWTASIVAPIIALLTWKAIPLAPVEREKWYEVDWGGMALFCSGLVLIFIGLESAERLGWWDSGLVVSSLTGGGVLFSSAVMRAVITKRNRFGELIGLSNWNVRICMVIACLFGVLMTPTSLLIPTFIQEMGSLKPLQVSTATFVAFSAYLASIPLAIFLARRIEARLLIILGVTVIAVVAWMGGGISHSWRTEQFISMLVFQALGESIMLIGLIAAFVTNINLQHTIALGAYIPIARVMTPVVAGTVMSTWLRMAGDTSRASLSMYLQEGDPVVVERLSNIGLSGIAQGLTRESHVLGYISGFHLVFWVSVLSLALATLLRSSPPNPITPPRAVAERI